MDVESRMKSQGNRCQVWERVGIGCQVLALVVESWNRLLSLGIGCQRL